MTIVGAQGDKGTGRRRALSGVKKVRAGRELAAAKCAAAEPEVLVLPTRLTPDERMRIQLAYLTTEKITVQKLCEQFRRSRSAVQACLKGSDYEALRQQVQDEVTEEARNVMRRAAVHAAEEWVRSIPLAGDKGDHKPAKDLLTATRVVEETATGPTVVVNFGVKLGGGPAS